VMERRCQQCGVVFLPRSHSATLKYCSRKCFYESRKPRIKIPPSAS
jgi:hypothetical protein